MNKFKLCIIVTLVTSILLLAAGCGTTDDDISEETITTTDDQIIEEYPNYDAEDIYIDGRLQKPDFGNMVMSESSYDKAYTTGDLLEISQYIVSGSVIDVRKEMYGGPIYIFTFELNTIYRGEIEEETVEIYSSDWPLEWDQEYLLFLEGSMIMGIKSPTYRLMLESKVEISENQDTLYFMNDIVNTYEHNEQVLNNSEEIINYLESMENIIHGALLSFDEPMVMSPETLENYIDTSDLIVQIDTDQLIEELPSINGYFLKASEVYKGEELYENILYLLHKTIEPDKTYILFLQATEGSHIMVDENAYIDSDDEEMMTQFEALLGVE